MALTRNLTKPLAAAAALTALLLAGSPGRGVRERDDRDRRAR